MLIYDDVSINEDINSFKDYETDMKYNFIPKLEKEGFIVISTRDLVGKPLGYELNERISEFDSHPGADAWDMVIPKLAEKLKL